MKIGFMLDGCHREFEVSPGERALAVLKRQGVRAMHDGCNGGGLCGLCSILLDGKLVNSCLLLAPQLDGREVVTLDHYARSRTLTVVQAALLDAGAVQCGYCTPAFVLAIESLLARNPDPTFDQITDALSGLLCRCTGYRQDYTAVGLAARRLKDPTYTAPTAPEFREALRVVGKLGHKVDGPRLVRGQKAFVEDMVQPGACVLKMVRSPHAHAYVTSIDTSEAEKEPGVVYILTHENCPDVYYNQAGQGFPEPSPYDRKLISEKVRHVGDRVAAIVAETWEAAERAAARIRVEYELLKPVMSIDEAADDGAPLIHNSRLEYVVGAPEGLEEDNRKADPRDGRIVYQFPIHADPRRNIAASVHGHIGDVDRGFAEAEVLLEREYESSQVQCTPTETHVVYTRMDGDRLVIHASTQVPYHLRRIVASIVGTGENNVRVIKERVGGGFGSKQDIVLEEVAAYLTWVTGRAIYQRFTREEEFVACRTRHVMKVRVKLGARKDGKLTAVYMDLRANTGPYGSHCLTVPMNACSKALPLFLCDNIGFRVTTYYSNIAPTGAYQGYGAPKGSFALQLAMAELARELKMDHLELLEKNRVREGAVLEILKCLGEGREGKPELVSSCGLGPALKRGADLIGWGKRAESADPDVKVGKGLAIIQQGSGLPGLDSANAEVKLLSDGTFMVLSGGADIGTGLDTVVAKFVAEALAVDLNRVSVLSADTDVAPFDCGAYASKGTYFSGGAALHAANALKEKMLDVAVRLTGEAREELRFVHPGKIEGKAKTVTYGEIAHFAETGTGCGALSASGHYATDKSSFPYGAHFCQVAVNVRTGKVTVQKYFALQDCGTPVNPELALGQIYGGVLKTIGHSLYEEMVYDSDGRCLNPNFLDYKVPMIQDLPAEFVAELVDVNDPWGPYGAKSVSEISCNGAAPAIASAIHDAVGVWMRSWPFSPEKILRAMKKL
ncbi:MAG: molybdopterin-dependent oxidoreductase Mo/Fe-S-binding subunit [Candidatus Riflebacteria bacterium]|nr:molybdopterin-dependent oxidoreductase Mo/Fe-S-binding subunit [Candidatus Riflebacteria bacterium]